MAFFVNKWLSYSPAFAFLLLVPFLPVRYGVTGTPNRSLPHPFHVSVVEINHNAADQTLEISCKIFTDDFEKTLARNYKTKVDLINPPDKNAMDSLVKKYIFSHFSLRANGKPVSFHYLGFENDHEAAYGYIEVPGVASVKNISISSNIMYDMFDDQMNIFHVIVAGKRKSTKLNYPDKETTLEF